MLIAYVPLMFAIVGVLIYALVANPKVNHIGDVLFWTAWLVTMFNLARETVKIGAVLFLIGATVTACNMPSPLCPTGQVLKPPATAACTAAFLDAAQHITACAIAPSAPACVDDVIASGADLLACLPTCGLAGSLRVNKAVLRANIMESLKATGTRCVK